ncbi:MAG: TonB family protein [Bacteroidota bacterium]
MEIKYLYELGIVHTLLILGYWSFLRNERQYGQMRFFLVASALAAVIIPLLHLPKILSLSGLFSKGEESLTQVAIEAFPIEPIFITASETSFWSMDLIPSAYFLVTALLLLGFITKIFHLLILERRSNYQLYQGLYIRRVPNIRGSFTFFNWIFMGDEIKKEHEDFEAILKHEVAHAKLGHSYDLILFELFKVFFWWLPTSWFIQREIKKIHEYQADAHAIKSCDPEKYSSVLINATLKLNGLSLASSFHDGLILKRLQMMKQQVKKISLWKLGALSMLGALLFIVFACNEELDNEIRKMGDNSNAITFDQLPVSMQKELNDNKDELSFVKLNLPKDENTDFLKLAGIDVNTVKAYHVDEPDEAIYVAFSKDGKNFNYISEQSKMNDEQGELYTIVEEAPEYPGGLEMFYKYLAKEMQYPAEARSNGIEGRVYVQFVVDKDGSVTNVEPVKGIGFGCDEEAMRVVQSAGKFNPGKQQGMPVRVRLVLPIIFKLNPDQLNSDNTRQGSIVIDNVKINGGSIKVDAAYTDGIWKGKVLSPEGDALAGASIVVAGGTAGTVSDLDGTFQLRTSEKDNLNISFVGYETVLVKGK